MSSGETLTGRTLGDFTLRELIGEGGFGAVFRAEQRSLGRDAAVKVIHAGVDTDPALVARFLSEARLASRLEHPYAAHIYAFGREPDGLLWIAMEFVRGTTLEELVNKHPLLVARFVPFFERLCDVVHAAHEQGVIHRDLKPANVMVVSRGGRLFPKLLDLGIARQAFEAGQSGNKIGAGTNQDVAALIVPVASSLQDPDDRAPLGSPPYMSPEQWSDAASVDARSDIYSLGVLAFRALTGRYPFDASSKVELMRAHASARPKLGEAFPPELERALDVALATNPDARYPSCLEFAQAVRAAVSNSTAETAGLPTLDEHLVEDLAHAAPRPVADAIALLAAARSATQLETRLDVLLKAVGHWVGIVALASVAKVSSASYDVEVTALLDRLRRDHLAPAEWLKLAAGLMRPWRAQRALSPLPELVEFCFSPPGARFDAAHAALDLLEDAGTMTLAERLSTTQHMLQSMSFLCSYRLVVLEHDTVISLSGAGQSVPSMRDAALVDGHITMVDADGAVALDLWPVAQWLTPAPGATPQVFLLNGAGRHGARLVAHPLGFERSDEALWEHFKTPGLEGAVVAAADREQQATPYRGLAPFTAADSDDFVGREQEAEAFANRLRVTPLMAVVGPSGAGKSSFVQAGVLPLLGAELEVLTIRPGSTPLSTLAVHLKQRFNVETSASELRGNPAMLGRLLAKVAARDKVDVVLVVDQFEELITLCDDPAERDAYARLLSKAFEEGQRVSRTFDEGQIGKKAASAREATVRVIITLRDDFLIRVQALPALRENLARGLQLLGTPARQDLRRILIEPARRAGYEFETEALVEEMVGAVLDLPGALALLSFTASRLWDFRDRQLRRLGRKAYDALGGVGGALAQHADATLASLSVEDRRLAREAFRHLVTAQGTRSVLSREELLQILGRQGGARVIERLINARLLVSSDGADAIDRVEVIHEALLSSWPALVRWRSEDAENARVRDQLRAAARQWEEQRRPRDLLWRGQVLEEYRLWRVRNPGHLTDAEAAFTHASQRAEASRRWLRRGLGAAVVLALLGVYSVAKLRERQATRAAVEKEVAHADVELTQAQALQRERDARVAQAFKAYDELRLADGASAWAQAQALKPDIQHHLTTGAHLLEMALRRDPGSVLARDRMVALLDVRAIESERTGEPAQKRELLERLRIYDVSGQTVRRWTQPGTLSVQTTPAATVELWAFEAGGRTSTLVKPLGELQASLKLAEGSYRLRVEAGAQTVDYPFTLAAGEHRAVSLRLPGAALPAGYVYVAPGAFLYGSALPDALRELLNARPIRARMTEGFFVAAHEVTYAEWLTWLRALPEQARKTVLVAQARGHAALRLDEQGFLLTMRLGELTFTAREGEPFVYAARQTRVQQDWSRFPVTGVSFDEAAAYARWLDQTGRVPGARLCTDLEWERAARGADDRPYPHGSSVEPDDGNIDVTYGKVAGSMGPDEVGSHPASRSPFGVDDLFGNAFEWVRGTDGDGEAVERGGSFFFNRLLGNASNREPLDHGLHDVGIGVRLCATPPASLRDSPQ